MKTEEREKGRREEAHTWKTKMKEKKMEHGKKGKKNLMKMNQDRNMH